MRRTATMSAGVWLLAGVLVGVVTPPRPAAATNAAGPLAALQKAHDVADQAAHRAKAMNAEVQADRHTASKRTEGESKRTERERSNHASPSRAEDAATSQALTPASAGTTAPAEAHAEATEAYDPAKHRDPFQPPTLAGTNDDEGPRTPLERYEVGQLKLVGVVWGPEQSRAMVEDSAGLGYIVTRGTPIGSSGGFVRAIEPNRVLIEETTTNFYGEPEPRELVMELSREDGSP